MKLLNCSISSLREKSSLIAKLFKSNKTIKQSNNSTIHKGFTLIELLVVIAIIGILAAFVVASFTSVQKKGRDARRKADLDAIKKALQLYYNDNGAYPITGGWVRASDGGVWIPGLSSQYIKNLPQDPANTTDPVHPRDGPPSNCTNCYNYAYFSNNSFCTIGGRDYILVARLEGYSGSDLSQIQFSNPDGSFCSNWSETANNGLYVVGKP